jgi:hypothetical protein
MTNDSQHYMVDAERSISIERRVSYERRLSVHPQSPDRREALPTSNQACTHTSVDDNMLAGDVGNVHVPIPLSEILELRKLNDDVTKKKFNEVISKPTEIPRQLRKKERKLSKLTERLRCTSDKFNLVPQTLRDYEYTVATKLKQMFDVTGNQHSETLSSSSDTSKDTEKEDSLNKNQDLDSTDDCESQDLEFGVFEERSNVIRAYIVQLDTYLPSAVEFDPDEKLPMYRHLRFQFYICLVMTVALVGIVGALASVALVTNGDPVQVPYRGTLGIRETIELFVHKNELEDPTSPYRKALDWITYNDPMAVTPEQAHFVQRYIIAYLYFATSVKQPWNSGCAPVSPDTREQADRCQWLYMVDMTRDPWHLSAYRWLSGASECDWAGIECDESLQIRSVLLSKC